MQKFLIVILILLSPILVLSQSAYYTPQGGYSIYETRIIDLNKPKNEKFRLTAYSIIEGLKAGVVFILKDEEKIEWFTHEEINNLLVDYDSVFTYEENDFEFPDGKKNRFEYLKNRSEKALKKFNSLPDSLSISRLKLIMRYVYNENNNLVNRVYDSENNFDDYNFKTPPLTHKITLVNGIDNEIISVDYLFAANNVMLNNPICWYFYNNEEIAQIVDFFEQEDYEYEVVERKKVTKEE